MQSIWYHTNTTPQQIGTHNNGMFIGNFGDLAKCLEGARKVGACGRPNWPAVVCAVARNGDYHLFQTPQHWQEYPSPQQFDGAYSDTITV